MFTAHLRACYQTMEHAKRMILIPEDSIDKHLSIKNRLHTVQTPGTAISRLDEEMSKIMNSPTIHDDNEKYKMYQQALQRFIYYNNNKERVDSKEFQREILNNEIVEDEKKPILDKNINNIISTIPTKLQFKAEQILQRLSNYNGITWDDRGIVSIDGSVVKGGNILDFIHDTVRRRKQPLSKGYDQFAKALRDASIPHEFILNQQARKRVATDSEQSEDEESNTFDKKRVIGNSRKRSHPIETDEPGVKIRIIERPWIHL